MNTWKLSLGGSWESFREVRGNGVTLYCCRRPVGATNWKRDRFPYAHVYVMRDCTAEDIDGETIEHYRFQDEGPLELEAVIYEVRSKYSP